MSAQETWIAVANSDELKAGEMRGIKIDGFDIAIYNLDGIFYATSNICSHGPAYMTDGFIDGDMIECPFHAGLFCITTGKAMTAPVTEDLKTYPTRVVGNAIEVCLN